MKLNYYGIYKGLTLCLLISFFLFTAAGSVHAADIVDIQNALDRTNTFYFQQEELVSGNAFEYGGDWEALGIRCSGYDTSWKYTIEESPVIASDYARAILGGIAADADNNTISDYLDDLAAMQNEDGSFVNGSNTSLNQTIWPVIAFDFAAANGFTTEDYTVDEAVYAVNHIISCQDLSGAFDEGGYGWIDVDGTAHALIALAPHQDVQDCSAAIDKGLAYLQTRQTESGAFLDAFGGESPDSTAAAIEALVALGEDLEGDMWQGDMVEALLDYQLENGGFYAGWSPGSANAMTTYHALLALADAINGDTKYQNDVPSTNGLSLFIDAPGAGFELDNDAAMQITVGNAGNSDQDLLIMMALYDPDAEKMIGYTALESEIEGDRELSAHYGLTIPPSGTYQVRVMIWDNWNNAIPLLPIGYLPVD